MNWVKAPPDKTLWSTIEAIGGWETDDDHDERLSDEAKARDTRGNVDLGSGQSYVLMTTRAGALYFVLALLFLSVAAPGARASVPAGSTDTGLSGEFRDLLLDVPLGVMLVDDASGYANPQGPNGVVLLNLTTEQPVARIPVPNPSGMALSPSGSRLAVASTNDFVDLIDLGSRQLITTVFLQDPGWDVAFVSEDRVVVTVAAPEFVVGGGYPAFVVNFTMGAVVSQFAPSPYGFYGFDPSVTIQLNARRGLAYVLDSGTQYVYNVSATNASFVTSRSDANFSAPFVLTADGSQLAYASGRVYAASTLTFVRAENDSGAVALGSWDGRTYFASGWHVDVVATDTSALLGRYFHFDSLSAGDQIRPMVADEPRGVAYVITGDTYSGRSLRAVPFRTGIVDPYPPDGALLGFTPFGVGAIVSGNISPSQVTMTVDGSPVVTGFNSTQGNLYELSPSYADGNYDIVVSGQSQFGGSIRLEWNFSVDTQPPQIVVYSADQAFRVPFVTLHGAILDPHFAWATANGLNLSVNPTNGSFSLNLSLSEGGNPLIIRAADTLQHINYSYHVLLYVPSTQTYVDAPARFSISFPDDWTARQDVNVSGVQADLVVNASPVGGFTPNFNVIGTGPLANYTNASVLAAAQAGFSNLSRLTGFLPIERPHTVAIPNLVAATYAYQFQYAGVTVYQRQYLIASAQDQQSWVVTFSASANDFVKFDRLYEWIAGTFEPWAASPGPSPTPWSEAPLLLILAGGAAAGAAAVGVAILLARRRIRERPETQVPQPPESMVPEASSVSSQKPAEDGPPRPPHG